MEASFNCQSVRVLEITADGKPEREARHRNVPLFEKFRQVESRCVSLNGGIGRDDYFTHASGPFYQLRNGEIPRANTVNGRNDPAKDVVKPGKGAGGFSPLSIPSF